MSWSGNLLQIAGVSLGFGTVDRSLLVALLALLVLLVLLVLLATV